MRKIHEHASPLGYLIYLTINLESILTDLGAIILDCIESTN